MADKRADLSGKPEDFEQTSGTAKLERKKVVLGRNRDADNEDTETDTDESVRTADLRDRMKRTLKRREAKDEQDSADTDDAPTQDLQPDRLGTERVIKKGTERVVKKKVVPPETEEKPKAAGSNKSDSQRMLRPKSLAGMSDEEKIQTQELLPHEMDPSRRRETDTANLKRIRPGKTSAEGVSAAGETGTDTIHLRVIKEKKNQLKNILSASQTIRLRPSPTDTSANKKQQAPSDESTSGDGEKKRTLKIKAPSTTQDDPTQDETQKPKTSPLKTPEQKEDPRTAAVSRDKLKETAVPTQLKRKSGTEKQEGPSTDTVKLKAPSKKELADDDSGGGAQKQSTLKIKAPAPTESPAAAPEEKKTTDTRPVPTASDSKSDKKSTLKIKAPAAGEAPSSDSASKQTVKQKAPQAAGGKTLKLKAAPKTQTLKAASPGQQTVKQAAPSVEAASAEAAAPAEAYDEPVVATSAADEPGILYTLGAAASLVLGGAVAALSAMQFFNLFQ